MSTDTRSVLTTTEDVMNFMAPFAGGSVPANTTTEFADWLRWIALGQQDAANRGFWRRLLTKADLSIVKDEVTTDLPDNFFKINGIYALYVNDIDWNQNGNTDDVQIFVEMNPTTAVWRIRWLPDGAISTATGALWYFFNPPKIAAAADAIFLDGEMIGFYALKEYFRKLKQLGSMDDARIEYENRSQDLLSSEMLPSPQEMAKWSSYQAHRNVSSGEARVYTGRADRSRSR